MKPRTIVYGLGKRFQQYFYEIHETYNVVGYCDANPGKTAMFSNGMTKEELATRQDEYDQILITLAGAIRRMAVVVEMIKCYEIDALKFAFFDVQSETPALREGKDTLYHPEMVFWGKNNEDAVIYWLSCQMKLDLGTLTYFESGLGDLRVGSVTYGLYKQGARGVLTVSPYDALYDEIKMFRAEDRIVDIRKDIQNVLNEYEAIDIIALHDKACMQMMLDEDIIFKFKPVILIIDDIEQDKIEYIRAREYVWHSTLSATSAIFCRAEKYLSEDVRTNRG